MPDRALLRQLTRYTQWADDVVLTNTAQLPIEALEAERDTLFGSIAGTFDHILVVAEMFEAHLEGRTHPHTARRRAHPLPFAEVADRLRAMDAQFVARADAWDEEALAEPIEFTFVDGGAGRMTRAEILMHLANHATYHRGFVSTLIYPSPVDSRANDYTVFLRDAWPAIAATLQD